MSNRRHCIINRLRFALSFTPLPKILPDRPGVKVNPIAIIKPAEPLAEFTGGEGVAVTYLRVNAGPAQCAVLAVDANLQGNEVVFSRTGSSTVKQVAEAGALVAYPNFQWRG